MAVFRVPYPDDPDRRRELYHRVVGLLSRHGTHDGTPEQGTFQGSTPIGRFAGSYRVLEASSELEIELTKKPLLLSAHLVEKEVRKFLSAV